MKPAKGASVDVEARTVVNGRPQGRRSAIVTRVISGALGSQFPVHPRQAGPGMWSSTKAGEFMVAGPGLTQTRLADRGPA
jgi:hypothetical protein